MPSGRAAGPPERSKVGDPRAHPVPVGEVLQDDAGRRLRYPGGVREDVGEGDPDLPVGGELRPVGGDRDAVVELPAVGEHMDER